MKTHKLNDKEVLREMACYICPIMYPYQTSCPNRCGLINKIIDEFRYNRKK